MGSLYGRDRIIMLQESAEDLGFGTIQQAIDAGYHEVQDLEHNTFKLEKIDEQEKAHEAWLKEREEVLEGLNKMRIGAVHGGYGYEHETLERAIEFIRKGEM